MNRKLKCAALVLGLAAAGCYRVAYETDLPAGGPVRTQTATFFLGGLIGETTVDLQALCPNGVARWQNEASPVDTILTYVTVGIFTPRTITVTCAGGRAYRALPHPERGMTELVQVDPTGEGAAR